MYEPVLSQCVRYLEVPLLQFGEVPLVKAAYRGWTEFVRILIEYGADVNALDLVSEKGILHNVHVL